MWILNRLAAYRRKYGVPFWNTYVKPLRGLQSPELYAVFNARLDLVMNFHAARPFRES